jgi:hypothetical protein
MPHAAEQKQFLPSLRQKHLSQMRHQAHSGSNTCWCPIFFLSLNMLTDWLLLEKQAAERVRIGGKKMQKECPINTKVFLYL